MNFDYVKYLESKGFLFAELISYLFSDVKIPILDGNIEVVRDNSGSYETDYERKEVYSVERIFSTEVTPLSHTPNIDSKIDLTISQKSTNVREFYGSTYVPANYPEGRPKFKWEPYGENDLSHSPYDELDTKIKTTSTGNSEHFRTIIKFSTKKSPESKYNDVPTQRIEFNSDVVGLDGFYHLTGKSVSGGKYELTVKFWDIEALKIAMANISAKKQNAEDDKFLPTDKDFEELYILPVAEYTYVIDEEMLKNVSNVSTKDLYMAWAKTAVLYPKTVIEEVLKNGKQKETSNVSRLK